MQCDDVARLEKRRPLSTLYSMRLERKNEPGLLKSWKVQRMVVGVDGRIREFLVPLGGSCPVPTAHLPWVFLIGATGNEAANFDGPD